MNAGPRSPLPAVILIDVGLIVATVAALLVWPFSRPLLWILCVLLAAFFLFSFAVLALTVPILVGTVWTRLAAGAGDWRKPPAPSPSRAPDDDPELWDRWLDGP